ncbi:MAG: glycine oxidase ThiO [Magnetococcales bacterium]|nr:glycine oxidase ThiO [Magnetococcales bacterium]
MIRLGVLWSPVYVCLWKGSVLEHVIVIGAGVMGCACAMRLLQAGLKVTLLERSLPGAESSAAAAGILGAQSEVSDAGPFFELCLESRSRFREFAKELEEISDIHVGYEDSGVLEVALDPAEGRLAVGRAEWMLDRGLNVDVLDREEARKIEPALTEQMVGANFYPDDHQVDSVGLARALAASAARLGADFRTGARVSGVSVENGQVTGVITEQGVLNSDRVVVAGGAWSTRLTGLPPLRTSIRPMAGQIIQVETRPPIFRHVVYGYSGYVVPRADGRVLMGSTLEDRGFDKAVTTAGLNRITGMALRMVPGLENARLMDTWSGLRPANEDGFPLLGEASVQGLYFATGHYRNGILLTTITADVIRDLVVHGKTEVDVEAFKP